jgi:hypothetical protein
LLGDGQGGDNVAAGSSACDDDAHEVRLRLRAAGKLSHKFKWIESPRPEFDAHFSGWWVNLGGYPPLPPFLGQSIHSKLVTRKVFNLQELHEHAREYIFRINGLQWI